MNITTRQGLSRKLEMNSLFLQEWEELKLLGGYEPIPAAKILRQKNFKKIAESFHSHPLSFKKSFPNLPRTTIIDQTGTAFCFNEHYMLIVKNYSAESDDFTAEIRKDGSILDKYELEDAQRSSKILLGIMEDNTKKSESDCVVITPKIARFIFGVDKKTIKAGMMHVKIGNFYLRIEYLKNLISAYYHFSGTTEVSIFLKKGISLWYTDCSKFFMGILAAKEPSKFYLELESLEDSEEFTDSIVSISFDKNFDKNEERKILVFMNKEHLELDSRINNNEYKYGLRITTEGLEVLFNELKRAKEYGTF